MNSDLGWRTLRKSLLLFVVALFLVSLVVAQELSLEVGDYIIIGEDLDDGVAGEVRFDDFDLGDMPVEITSSSEEFVILIEGVRGTLDEDGIVHGVAEMDGAYISIQLDPSTVPRLREFEEGVEFTYNIFDDELTILKGGVHIGDERIEAENDSELSIIGKEVFLDGQATIESIGLVDLYGSFVPESDGVLFSGREGSEIVSTTDALNFEGDLLYANDRFQEEGYDGAYFQSGDGFLKMKSVDGTVFSYKPLVGNTILDKRQATEAFDLILTGGGEVAITNREDSRQTPLVDVIDDAGVKLVNGWYTDDEGHLLIDPPSIDSFYDLRGAATTLPLVAHFPDNTDAIFSSANGYILLSSGREIARLNDIGSPITDDFSDNDIRTVEDLQKEWPQYIFYVEQTETIEYTPSTASVQVTHQWLQDHPDTPLHTLVFSDVDYSYAELDDNSINFADALYELTREEEEILAWYGTDREIGGDPYRTLTHENAHLITSENGDSLLREYNNVATAALDKIIKDGRYRTLNNDVYRYVHIGKPQFFLSDAGKGAELWYSRGGDLRQASSLYIDICFLHSEADPVMKQCRVQFEQLASEYGLPAGYSLQDYGTDTEPAYSEMPSTWIEEPLEQRIYRANYGNEYQKEVYTQLAQLAYDSDQITKTECDAILGDCEKGVLWTPR